MTVCTPSANQLSADELARARAEQRFYQHEYDVMDPARMDVYEPYYFRQKRGYDCAMLASQRLP